MQTNTYTYKYIYIYVYIHLVIHSNIKYLKKTTVGRISIDSIYIRTYVHAYIQIHRHKCVNTCVSIKFHVQYLQTMLGPRMHICIHSNQMPTHLYSRTYMCIHRYIHIYVCIFFGYI